MENYSLHALILINDNAKKEEINIKDMSYYDLVEYRKEIDKKINEIARQESFVSIKKVYKAKKVRTRNK